MSLCFCPTSTLINVNKTFSSLVEYPLSCSSVSILINYIHCSTTYCIKLCSFLSDVELLSMDSTKASCWVNNKLRAHEEQWKEDDCTFCQCVDGEPHCTAMACKQSCQNPVKIPGECCPFCEGKEPLNQITPSLFIYHVVNIYMKYTLAQMPQVGGSCGPSALLQRLCRRGLIKGEATEHS